MDNIMFYNRQSYTDGSVWFYGYIEGNPSTGDIIAFQEVEGQIIRRLYWKAGKIIKGEEDD